MKRAKILVVDDDPICTGLLLAILGDTYQVTAVNTGLNAIELLDALPHDLILLDIIMPEMNGYQVLRHIKSEPVTLNTPIIMISSLVDKVDESLALKMGADDYIFKPVTPNILHEKIEHHLQACLRYYSLQNAFLNL